MTNADDLRELAEAEEPRGAFQAQPGLGGVLRPGGADVTEILLIRHGQMPATSDTRSDQPLTELGLRQADILGRFLASKPLHALYSSPALRAVQTAEGIGRHCGLDVQVIHDLREMDTFIPEGVDWDDLRQSEAYQAMNERFAKERRWEAYEGLRESGAGIRKRVTAVVDELVPRHTGQRIALVTHSPVVSCYIAAILDSPYDSSASIQLTGVTTILAAGDRRRILNVNSRTHFGL
jgi:broad specificity phosphatase PhoE